MRYIIIVSFVLTGIIIFLSCYDNIPIDISSHPEKSSVLAIKKCSDFTYTPIIIDKFITNLTGMWKIGDTTVVFNPSGKYYVLIGRSIISGGYYGVNSKGGLYELQLTRDSRWSGVIWMCNSRLYNSGPEQVWEFDCKCYL